jgi:hypothetical protein
MRRSTAGLLGTAIVVAVSAAALGTSLIASAEMEDTHRLPTATPRADASPASPAREALARTCRRIIEAGGQVTADDSLAHDRAALSKAVVAEPALASTQHHLDAYVDAYVKALLTPRPDPADLREKRSVFYRDCRAAGVAAPD